MPLQTGQEQGEGQGEGHQQQGQAEQNQEQQQQGQGHHQEQQLQEGQGQHQQQPKQKPSSTATLLQNLPSTQQVQRAQHGPPPSQSIMHSVQQAQGTSTLHGMEVEAIAGSFFMSPRNDRVFWKPNEAYELLRLVQDVSYRQQVLSECMCAFLDACMGGWVLLWAVSWHGGGKCE
jgi:hypothetical protein